MGFYLKKSIKLGPLRLNLSNSGIGVSTGIKGLRAGVDAKGRTYIGGGKGILRYRKQIGKIHDSSGSETDIWKAIAVILFIALLLTAIYFIKPDFFDSILKFILMLF